MIADMIGEMTETGGMIEEDMIGKGVTTGVLPLVMIGTGVMIAGLPLVMTGIGVMTGGMIAGAKEMIVTGKTMAKMTAEMGIGDKKAEGPVKRKRRKPELQSHHNSRSMKSLKLRMWLPQTSLLSCRKRKLVVGVVTKISCINFP